MTKFTVKEKVNSSERYLELDCLRGIAAIMVVFFHYTMGRPEADLGFKIGTTGVDLFFIISGFVIYMSLSKIQNGKDFIINRISRLYPAYWASVSLTFVFIIINTVIVNGGFENYWGLDYHIFPRYLANLTMFQFYLGSNNLDGPYWTMIIEMLFYIFIYLLFKIKALKYIHIIGVSLSLIIVISNNLLNFPIILLAMKVIPLLQFLPLFFTGIFFYKLYIDKVDRILNYSVIIICIISQIFMYEHAGYSNLYISHKEYATALFLYFIVFTLFVNGNLKFIISKPLLFLGKISFPLYLIHQFISLEFLIPLLNEKMNINYWVSSVCISLPFVIIFASLITYFIEIPYGQRLKFKLKEVFK